MGELCQTINGIACAVLDDGYKASFSNSGTSSASRKIKCAWTDAPALKSYLLTANNTTISGFTFEVGEEHPLYVGLFVDTVDIEPLNGLFKEAVLVVGYKPSEFDPLEPTVIREDRIGIASNVVPLMKESFKFGDGKSGERDADYLVAYIHYSVTFKNVSTVPIGAVMTCYSKVHSGTMTVKIGSGSSTTVPGDQVLYNGIEDIVVGYTSSGPQKFDVTHNFLIAPISLQKEYNPYSTAGNVWDRFEVVTPTKYGTANFSSLGV